MNDQSALQQQTPCSPDRPEVNSADSFNTSTGIASQTEPDSLNCKNIPSGAVSPRTLQRIKYEEFSKLVKQTSLSIRNKLLDTEPLEVSDSEDTTTGTVTGSSEKKAESGYLDAAKLNQILDSNSARKVAVEKLVHRPPISLNKKYRKQVKSKVNRLVPDSETGNSLLSGDDSAKMEPESVKEHNDVQETNRKDKDETVYVVDSIEVKTQTTDDIQEVDEEIQNDKNIEQVEAVETEINSNNPLEFNENRGDTFKTDECNEKTSASSMHDNENLKLGSDADVEKEQVKNLDSKIINKQIDSGLGQDSGDDEDIVGSTTGVYKDVQLLIDFAAKVGNDGVNNKSETATMERKAEKHAEETENISQQSDIINTEHEVLGNANTDSDMKGSSSNNSGSADTARNRTETINDIGVQSEIISTDSSVQSDSIEKDNVPDSKILHGESVLQNETDQMLSVVLADGNTISEREIEGHSFEADIKVTDLEDESKVRSSEQIEDTPKKSEQQNTDAANYDHAVGNNENYMNEEEENTDAPEGETLMIIDVRSLTVDDSNEICFNEDKNENGDEVPERNAMIPCNKNNDADFEVTGETLSIENKVVSGESQLRILEEAIKSAVKESEELEEVVKDSFELSNLELNQICERSDDISAKETLGATVAKNIVPEVIKIPVEKASSLNKGLVPSVMAIPKDSLSSSKADKSVEAQSNILKSNDVHEYKPESLNTFLECQSKALESILNTTTSHSQDTAPVCQLNTTNATGSGARAPVDTVNTTTAGKKVKAPLCFVNTTTAASNLNKDPDNLVSTKAITDYRAKTPVCLAKCSDSDLVNPINAASNQIKSSVTTTSHVNTVTTTDSQIVTVSLVNSATCILNKITTPGIETPVPPSLVNPNNYTKDQTKILKSKPTTDQLANTPDNIGNVKTSSGSQAAEYVRFGNVRATTGEKTKSPISTDHSTDALQGPVNVNANLIMPATTSARDSSTPVNEGNESLPVIANSFSIKDFFDSVKQEPPDDGTYGILQSTAGAGGILRKQGAPVTSTASGTSNPLSVKRNPTIHQGKIIKSGSMGLTNTTNTPKIVMAKVNSLKKLGQSDGGLVTTKITSQNVLGQTQTLTTMTTRSVTGKAVPVTINNAKTPAIAPLVVNVIRPQPVDVAVKPKTSIVVVHPNTVKPVDTQDPAQNNKLSTINIFSVGVARITDLIARKNPIPTYKPARPPDELKMADTLEVYECYECGDRFNFERSLKIHLGRSSMKIFFKCEKCHKTLIFTNKCQLLCHLRSHLKIHKSQAVPIHIKSDSIEIRTNFDDIKPGQPFEWYKESLAVPFLNNGAYQSKNCMICNKNFLTDDELRKHYSAYTGKWFFCRECPLFMNSQCALLAHSKLHKLTSMKRPHPHLQMQKGLTSMKNLTCPECGKNFVLKSNCPSKFCEITNIFLMHLKTECFHLSRLPTYKCTKCKMVCQGKEELRNHIYTSLDQYYKCGKCPMALKSLKSLDSHFVQKHVTIENAEELGSSRAKIIYRCHICDTLIDDKSFLLQHVDNHMEGNSIVVEVIYHCLQCGQLFETKPSLVVHFQTHVTVRNHFMCTFCPRKKMDALSYIEHILQFHTSSQSYRTPACVVKFCNLCGLVCKGEAMSRKHVCLAMKNAPKVVGDMPEKRENPIVGEKVKAASETPTPDDVVLIDNSFVKEWGREPVPSHLSPECIHCGREFTSSADRRNHLNFIRDSDQIYICKFCDKTPFNKYHDLTSHEICCNAKRQMIEKAALDKVFENIPKTAIEKLYEGLPDKNKQSSSETIETEGVQLFPKGNKRKRNHESEVVESYICDQCDEVFTRKSKQEEHIKSEHGFHPCHLCGLMHESQSSLKKHLMIDHEGKRMMFFCGICKLRKIDKAFSLKVKLEKHLRQKHKMKVADESKIITALPGLDSSKETSPANEQKRRNSESSNSDLPAKKVKFEEGKNGFNCAKCLFQCEMRSEFRQHIVQHLTADSYQCYECGLCFAVLPSLKKHLFMVHKIRNFENYMEENKIEAPVALDDKDIGIIWEPETQEVNEESSEEDTFSNPLECRVCYKVFESEKNLRGHMRVHGMAFIKKTRRRALTSSPNKKREHEVSSPEKESEKKGLILKIKKSRIESTDNKTDGSECTVHYVTESNDDNRSSVGENKKQMENEVTVDAAAEADDPVDADIEDE